MNTEDNTGGQQRAYLALKKVIDPEIGLNVVDLGLILDLNFDDGNIELNYRLTSPICPVGGMIARAMDDALRTIPGVKDVDMMRVDDPPWNPECISPQGREQLGF